MAEKITQKLKEKFTVYKNDFNEYFLTQDKEKKLKEIEVAVRRPNYKELQNAQFEYSKMFTEYLKKGVMTNLQMTEFIEKNGMWDAEKTAKEKELRDSIRGILTRLKRGKMKLSELKKLSAESIKKRFELIELTLKRNEMLTETAESRATQHRFNYLTSVCTVYNTSSESFFKNLDDFLDQDAKGSIVTFLAGQFLAKLLNNLDEDFRKDWDEYKLLQKYHMVNDKLEWVDRDGKLVDEAGKPVDLVTVPEEDDIEPEFEDDLGLTSHEEVVNDKDLEDSEDSENVTGPVLLSTK